MNKQKLTILSVEHRSGFSRKNGAPWEMHEAQVILEQETNDGLQRLAGGLNLPKNFAQIEPGDYIAEFQIFKSMEGKFEPRVVSLVPLGGARPVPKAKEGAGVAA